MIKIINWSKHQSYKDRRPPWIRFHRTMLDDYEYQSMSADSRALLPMLWLLACEDKDPKSGLIQLEIKAISFRLRQPEKVINKCLDELQAADFIECIESVTKPLQDRNETVTPETETETETDNGEFELVWEMYERKGNKKTSQDKFDKMTEADKQLMSKHLPEYVKSTPNKRFRKGFESYINLECWNDEILSDNNSTQHSNSTFEGF